MANNTPVQQVRLTLLTKKTTAIKLPWDVVRAANWQDRYITFHPNETAEVPEPIAQFILGDSRYRADFELQPAGDGEEGSEPEKMGSKRPKPTKKNDSGSEPVEIDIPGLTEE